MSDPNYPVKKLVGRPVWSLDCSILFKFLSIDLWSLETRTWGSGGEGSGTVDGGRGAERLIAKRQIIAQTRSRSPSADPAPEMEHKVKC